MLMGLIHSLKDIIARRQVVIHMQKVKLHMLTVVHLTQKAEIQQQMVHILMQKDNILRLVALLPILKAIIHMHQAIILTLKDKIVLHLIMVLLRAACNLKPHQVKLSPLVTIVLLLAKRALL